QRAGRLRGPPAPGSNPAAGTPPDPESAGTMQLCPVPGGRCPGDDAADPEIQDGSARHHRSGRQAVAGDLISGPAPRTRIGTTRPQPDAGVAFPLRTGDLLPSGLLPSLPFCSMCSPCGLIPD